MSFLNDEPDLEGTYFTKEKLSEARLFIVDAIEKHDASWLKKPTGPLRIFWNQDGAFSACYIIELCRIFSELQTKITKKSETVLVEKFKNLLRARNNKVYEEILTELQVACVLSERASPIAFDPLVPENLIMAPIRPRTTDFAIRLPGGDVIIEVTVFRVEKLITWDREIVSFQDALQRFLKKQKKKRIIRLRFPLSFRVADLPQKSMLNLMNRIADSETGELSLTISSKFAFLDWQPLPNLSVAEGDPRNIEIDLPSNTNFAILSSKGSPEPASAAAFEARLVDENYGDLILRSLRNTLKLKRKQFVHEAPYLLVMKPGHHRLIADGIVGLINERIWPNPSYGWITGICFFQPGRQFLVGDPPSSLKLILNPNTRNPAPKALADLFEETATYHLHKQQPSNLASHRQGVE